MPTNGTKPPCLAEYRAVGQSPSGSQPCAAGRAERVEGHAQAVFRSRVRHRGNGEVTTLSAALIRDWARLGLREPPNVRAPCASLAAKFPFFLR